MNLYGWDMAYGASVELINRQMALQSQTLITDFNYQRTQTDGSVLSLSGQFGPWSVIDGNNNLITVRLPIKQGYLSLTGSLADWLSGTSYQAGQHIDVSGVFVDLQMSLNFKVSPQDPNVHQLVFDLVVLHYQKTLSNDKIL
ncbi:MAG: TULIP family P47-like protein [Lewinella sp.]|nr:TULIP family P47-like protein [Lewinella sp.]